MAMNMMDMIMQAAGGNTAQQAGGQFGLSPQQSQQAIGALLPAISSAMKRNCKMGAMINIWKTRKPYSKTRRRTAMPFSAIYSAVRM